MNAKNYRYFQDRDGNVHKGSTSSGVHYALPGTRTTEVQVVPLDAIVIDGPLPEVEVEPEGYLSAGGAYSEPIDTDCNGTRPEWHERKALGHLAIAAHLRANPPVDAAQVKALAEALRDTGGQAPSWEGHARLLVQRGVRVEAGEQR